MEAINIVWFTKDLRLTDHAPLYHASLAGLPLLMVYCAAPSQTQHPTWSSRHSWFVHQSVIDIQLQLKPLKLPFWVQELEFIQFLELLQPWFQINTIYTHYFAVMQHSRKALNEVEQFCTQHHITLTQLPHNGLLPNQSAPLPPGQPAPNWLEHFKNHLKQPLFNPNLNLIQTPHLPAPLTQQLHQYTPAKNWGKPDKTFKPDLPFLQPGATHAQHLLHTFLQHRASGYKKNQTSAHLSQTSGSRLSAHLTFGNISLKQIWQQIRLQNTPKALQPALTAFKSNLLRRAYALQLFEMHPQLEYQNFNYAVNGIRLKWNQDVFDTLLAAQTGFPLIDAAMRCLIQTGFINHRLRTLVMAFITNHLWLDWRKATPVLAQLMTDFEPALFFWHTQTAANCTGLEPIFLPDPAAEAKLTDKTGIFIKQWLPVFAHTPGGLCGNPALMSALEQQLYHLEIGKHYPKPMVNLTTTTQYALANLQRIYQKNLAKKETARLASVLPLPAF
ncbi:MAG TPA: FAD-binding domain-containing protein [Chitinophagales bacterium]|nr:FAD-binding domain-containing protein [Chitinophagales bacterium]HRK27846.1 FAD-binding domain-containing protein [Chitinophagales bacterium]